jgi:predicted NAD/FAD-dependent oxidoreductase
MTLLSLATHAGLRQRRDMNPIAIIGAGMAGLACGLALAEAGREVVLFDKGRRPGGRIATRRAEGASFDHGAQYATVRGTGLASWMQRLAMAGTVAAWPPARRGSDIAWVGVPGMSALPGAMARQLQSLGAQFHAERHVAFIHANRLRHFPAASVKPGFVSDQDGDLTEAFDAVLLAVPAPQAVPLLAAIQHPFTQPAAATVTAPCWAVMASFAERIPAPDCQRPSEGPLAWIARDSGRPGHAPQPDAWVLHASAAWTRAHLEDPADSVTEALLGAFRQIVGTDAVPLSVAGHRWRHALVERPLGHPCLWDAATRIGACGDWCLGHRVEAAFDSGTALAHAVLGR